MGKNMLILLPLAAAVLAGALIPIQASSGGVPVWLCIVQKYKRRREI